MATANSNSRAIAALTAMKSIGIPFNTAKPVLKNLLRVYENNWEYIEEENYRVLADAILDMQESLEVGDSSKKRKKKDVVEDMQIRKENDKPGPYRTRQKVKQEDEHPLPSIQSSDASGASSLKRPRIEADVVAESHPQQRRAELASPELNVGGKATEPLSPHPYLRQKTADVVVPQAPQPSFIKKAIGVGSSQISRSCERAEPISPQKNGRGAMVSTGAQQASPLLANRPEKRPLHERSGNSIYLKEPKLEPGIENPRENDMDSSYTAATRLMDDSCGGQSPQFEVPLAMIPPPHPIHTGRKDPAYQDDSSMRNTSSRQTNISESIEQHAHRENERESVRDAVCNNATMHELAHVQEPSSTNIDIASSALGEVKVSLTCSSNRPDFHMPNLEDILKMVEDRCIKSYKILQPKFSVRDLMKEMCQCVLELGSESTEDKQENCANIPPALDPLKKPGFFGAFECSLNGSLNLATPRVPGMTAINGHHLNQNLQGNSDRRTEKTKESEGPESANIISNSLVVVQHRQVALRDLRQLHDADDISKGEERVRIPLVNDFSSEKFPLSFHYIPSNIVYQSAYVNFSLARIGDEDCCSDCFGDCLASSIPCACARETGGEFAYTPDGLIRKEFLDECISMNRDPQKHHHFYCKSCPLERSKNEITPDSCKGHLIRKFVKECWSKCGCNKQCGNRVVQRGITCNLQVFLTAEGKGWGVRTVDELPRGAFVCEYVGEILTNMELYDRTMQTTGNAKHTYPVLLDADWGSEGVLKDEEALCLDATFYGNVARFVNHRCFDANLVEVPVEVETPDHHYYHLAFFTTRKVEAFEELTWDYGIDFDDHDHPIKAFRCRCRSKYCRDMNRTKTRLRKLSNKES